MNVHIDNITKNEAALWFAIFKVAMSINRVCPICDEEQPHGSVEWKLLYQHLKAEHPEVYKPLFEGSKEQ